MPRPRTELPERAFGEQLAKRAVLPELSDSDERVTLLEDVSGLRAGHRLGLTEDGDDRDPRARAEPALGQRLSNRRAAVGDGHPFDCQLAERHLELLDDLRAIVGAGDHRAELTGFVILELDDRRRVLVAGVPEVIDLAETLVVEDDRHPASVGRRQAVLDADAG